MHIQGRAPQCVLYGGGEGNDGGPSPFQPSVLGSETGGYHYPSLVMWRQSLTENDITAPREIEQLKKRKQL